MEKNIQREATWLQHALQLYLWLILSVTHSIYTVSPCISDHKVPRLLMPCDWGRGCLLIEDLLCGRHHFIHFPILSYLILTTTPRLWWQQSHLNLNEIKYKGKKKLLKTKSDTIAFCLHSNREMNLFFCSFSLVEGDKSDPIRGPIKWEAHQWA